MLVPEIKDYFSADIEELETWTPEKLKDIYFVLEIEIGLKTLENGHLFQIVVTTPEALRARESRHRYLTGRHYLLVMDYKWSEIKKVINDLVSKCSGNSWNEVTSNLSRYFKWEYEDHKFVDVD